MDRCLPTVDGSLNPRPTSQNHLSDGGSWGRLKKNIPDCPLRPWEDHGGQVSRRSEGLLCYLGFNLLCSSVFPGQVKASTPGGQFFSLIHSPKGKDTEWLCQAAVVSTQRRRRVAVMVTHETNAFMTIVKITAWKWLQCNFRGPN